ncbi:MAG: ATP-binding protein [Pseudomonadota bacterium]
MDGSGYPQGLSSENTLLEARILAVADVVEAMASHRPYRPALTSQLLAYARGGKYNPQTMSLSNFVEGALPIIQYTLDPDIRVETDLPLHVMNVEVDRTQMQMVLSAIMANSNEAIDPPGRIRISTRNIDLDKEFIKDHPDLKPGSYICLSIEDDGKGMDEETRKKIFDPFFTTHFIGRGLGMASVYGIIKNHDGTITVDSEIGKGTVVRIYLPAIRSAQARRAGLPAIEAKEPSWLLRMKSLWWRYSVRYWRDLVIVCFRRGQGKRPLNLPRPLMARLTSHS